MQKFIKKLKFIFNKLPKITSNYNLLFNRQLTTKQIGAYITFEVQFKIIFSNIKERKKGLNSNPAMLIITILNVNT